MIVGFVTQTPSAFQDTELPNVGTINVTPRPQGPKLRFGPTDKLRVFFEMQRRFDGCCSLLEAEGR